MPTNAEKSAHLLSLHLLFLRLQQRNKFVGVVDHTGLSPLETHLIIEIQAEPGLTISAYASRMMVELSLCTRVIQKFARRGLVLVKPSVHDLRRKEVVVTTRGVALIDSIDQFANQVVALLRESQTDRSWSELIGFFRKLADGGGVPSAPRRPQEDEYRVQQRRITRLFGLLGNSAWGTALSSSEIQILTEVCHAPLPPRITELAELLGLQTHSTGEAISRFETEGLLQKRLFEGDGRVSVVVPTAKGRRFLAETQKQACAHLLGSMSGFSGSQSERLVNIMERATCSVDIFWPMLPRSLRIERVMSLQKRRAARGFVARTYVELGLEESLPERLLPEDHELFLIHRDMVLVGTVCFENRAGVLMPPHLCASSHLPPWSLAAAWGEVVRIISSIPREQLRQTFAKASACPGFLNQDLVSLARV